MLPVIFRNYLVKHVNKIQDFSKRFNTLPNIYILKPKN